MGQIDKYNVLTGYKVYDAMRKNFLKLYETDSIEKAITMLIKYKTSAILIVDKHEMPMGIVSKTDIMSAYYASFSLKQKLKDILVSPPVTCSEEDSLEHGLDLMRSNNIHRVYVYNKNKTQIVGLLAYPDIVGLMYRLCVKCKKSSSSNLKLSKQGDIRKKIIVKEVMSTNVQSKLSHDTIYSVIEALSQFSFGALLIRDNSNIPVGVVSKTDLLFAYKHGIDQNTQVKEIMSSKVIGCDVYTCLSEAIKKMIFSDIHRLFVFENNPQNIVGVVSFTDAARVKSGSCKACSASRIEI